MKRFVEMIGSFMFLVTWLAGIVLAAGFWSTTFAIFFPPWGWYLLVEKTLIVAGWVAI